MLVVKLPFTIEFDIIRNTLTSANVCKFRIYNLSLKNRNQLRFNISDYGQLRTVQFKGGYGNNLGICFQGNVSQAWSVREGVNFITQIECYDGGFAFVNGQTDAQFPAGATNQGVIANLAGSLPGVDVGAIGSYPGTLQRGASFSGTTTDHLRDLTGGGFFIDNGKANALGTNEYIQRGAVLTIDSKAGLLGTPVLEQTIVHFDMLWEPRLHAGEQVFLSSITEQNFNGAYKITGVKHRGIISESVCGSVTTTGEFLYTKLLVGVQPNG